MTTSKGDAFEVPSAIKALKNAEELARRVLSAGKRPTSPKKGKKRRGRKK